MEVWTNARGHKTIYFSLILLLKILKIFPLKAFSYYSNESMISKKHYLVEALIAPRVKAESTN